MQKDTTYLKKLLTIKKAYNDMLAKVRNLKIEEKWESRIAKVLLKNQKLIDEYHDRTPPESTQEKDVYYP